MRKNRVLVAAGTVALIAGMASPAGAIDDLIIPIDSIVSGAPGSTVVVASEPVDADLVGKECKIVLRGENNESVHPGNDLIVSTGSDSVTFEDVESEPGQVTEGGGVVTMGETVDVDLRFGDDGLSSGGFSLGFDCEQAPTTTVAPPTTAPTEVEPTVVTAPPTEVLPETTTSGLPVASPTAASAAQPTFTG